MPFMLANCRSIIQKTESVAEYFQNADVKFAMLTETWTDKRSEKAIKEKFENENGLGLIGRSRRGRGGGVAIVFRKSEIQFRRYVFFSGEYEIVAASAKIPAAKTMLFVFCAYYPPSMPALEVERMNDIIHDEIVKLKLKHERPLFIVAGDMNNKNCECFESFADFKLIKTAPTRNESCLDLCYTNVFIESNNVSMPLWSLDGIDSDHRVVIFNAAYISKKFTYTTIIRPRITARGEDDFCRKIDNYDWRELYEYQSAEEKTNYLHEVIEKFKAECFPMKRSRIRSDEDPWVTDHIRKRIKERNKTFQLLGRGEEWKMLRDEVREKLSDSREAYYEREVEKINNATNKKSLAFTALKNLSCADRPKQWSVRDIDRDKEEEVLVEELAEYFSSVTSGYDGVDIDRVQKTYDRPVYLITSDMVRERILASKKPNSSVPGDIPPKLLARVAASVSLPVADVFNAVVRDLSWPTKWKTEYQTIIPKVPNPSEYSQLRNLSCTNFLSKVFETFVADSIRSEVDLSDLQYGGIKGCGTDNFLVEMWNNVLEALDQPDSAISLMSVDFSKAFNRLDHQACLNKLVKKCASNQTIAMVAAFLSKRQMCVRTSSTMSAKRIVSGGSPQGTKLGNLLFCIAIDDITEYLDGEPHTMISPERAIPPQYLPQFASTPQQEQYDNYYPNDSFNPNPFGLRRKKNVINDTLPFTMMVPEAYEEVSTWEIGYIDDLNIGETLKVSEGEAHITTSREKRSIRAIGCEEKYVTIKMNGRDVGMLINSKKTQLLCISSSNTFEVECFVSIENEKLISGDSLKILGFMFDTKPTPKAHVKYLIEKFNRSLWTLFHLRRAKIGEKVLIQVYKSMLRPLLEYGSNAFHSMLNTEEGESLEKCQRRALRIIYGFEMSYQEMMNMSEMPTLKTRREKLFEKFCLKMSRSERFQRKWLPRKDIGEHNLRKTNEYIEFNARTSRLYNSPVYAMRRFMNSTN